MAKSYVCLSVTLVIQALTVPDIEICFDRYGSLNSGSGEPAKVHQSFVPSVNLIISLRNSVHLSLAVPDRQKVQNCVSIFVISPFWRFVDSKWSKML